MRTVSEEEVRTLKGATEAACKLGGGVTNFALLTRVNVATLSKYASINEEYRESLMPVDVAIEADRWAKSPVIVSAMAKALGYRLVPDDEAGLAAPGRLTERDAHTVLSEAMDVTRETLAAVEDGHADALERKKIRKELLELVRAAETMLLKVRG